MCTGVEAALIAGAVASAAGTAATTISAKKSATAQANARNTVLKNFLDKNETLSEEARASLQRRLDQGEGEPLDKLDPLKAKRAEPAKASIDRASASAPIPLGGNAPAVVANRATEAQESTDVEAKRRTDALAATRSFGDLLFEGNLGTQRAGREIGLVNSLARANASLLPHQQDLAQQSAASKGKNLALFGGVASALGTGLSGAAGAGAFGAGSGAGLTAGQSAINSTATAPVFSTLPRARPPINLGFG